MSLVNNCAEYPQDSHNCEDQRGCGQNASGQLGLGDTDNRLSPTQLCADKDWAAAAAGDDHNLAITTGGELWAWGSNGFGELGDTGVLELLPVHILQA